MAPDPATPATPPAAGLPSPAAVARPWLAGYPTGVAARFPYPDVALPRLLDTAAEDFPGAVAVRDRGAALTYRQLVAAVDRFAGALGELGVGRGDRVALLLPNCPEHVVAFFAVLRLGAVVTAVDPTSSPEEVVTQLRDSGSVVAVCRAGDEARVRPRPGVLPALRHVVTAKDREPLPPARAVLRGVADRLPPRGGRGQPGEGLALAELLAASAPTATQAPVDPARDVAVILYTGSAGRAGRGVALTHRNVVAGAHQARLWIPDVVAGGERILCVLPFSSPYGLGLGLGLGVLAAAALEIVPRFEPAEVLRAIATRRPTLLPAVPAVFVALCEAAERGAPDLGSVRVALAVGAPLPADVATAFERLTGGVLREGYGRPEAGPLTHATPVTGPARRGAVGLPVSDTAALLLDPQDPTRPVDGGVAGLLAVAGPQVMAGYWRRPEETARVLADGWLLTGDLAEVDGQGCLTIVDRGKDVVVVGGRAIAPQPIERVLRAHPAVARAVVVGVPDAEQGERLSASVVLRAGRSATGEELAGYLGERLPPDLVPRTVEVREALPDGLAGRALRLALVREALAQQRGA